MKWLGTICGIIGSLLVASNSGFGLLGYGFFLSGSMVCFYTSTIDKDKANMVLWAFFLVVNVWGIFNYAT